MGSEYSTSIKLFNPDKNGNGTIVLDLGKELVNDNSILKKPSVTIQEIINKKGAENVDITYGIIIYGMVQNIKGCISELYSLSTFSNAMSEHSLLYTTLDKDTPKSIIKTSQINLGTYPATSLLVNFQTTEQTGFLNGMAVDQTCGNFPGWEDISLSLEISVEFSGTLPNTKVYAPPSSTKQTTKNQSKNQINKIPISHSPTSSWNSSKNLPYCDIYGTNGNKCIPNNYNLIQKFTSGLDNAKSALSKMQPPKNTSPPNQISPQKPKCIPISYYGMDFCQEPTPSPVPPTPPVPPVPSTPSTICLPCRPANIPVCGVKYLPIPQTNNQPVVSHFQSNVDQPSKISYCPVTPTQQEQVPYCIPEEYANLPYCEVDILPTPTNIITPAPSTPYNVANVTYNSGKTPVNHFQAFLNRRLPY
jgi:hypothetical protein